MLLLIVVDAIIKCYRLSHDVVTCDVDRDVSTAYCLSSSGDEVHWLHGTIYITKVARLWYISILRLAPIAPSFRLLLCFLVGGIHTSGISISTVPFDVTRVKSFVVSFLDPMCVPVRISINKRDLVPNWIVVTLSSGNADGNGDAETCEKIGERTPLWQKFTNIEQRRRKP